jgi:hypothetical protein
VTFALSHPTYGNIPVNVADPDATEAKDLFAYAKNHHLEPGELLAKLNEKPYRKVLLFANIAAEGSVQGYHGDTPTTVSNLALLNQEANVLFGPNWLR